MDIIKHVLRYTKSALPGPLELALDDMYGKFCTRKVTQVISGIVDGGIDIEDAIKNPEFMQALITLSEAVRLTGVDEKIELLIRLFIANYGDDQFKDLTKYEFRLSILNELSLTELHALAILDSIQVKRDYDFDSTQVWWPKFKRALQDELEIPKDHINGFLTRLERSGLYTSTAWGDQDGCSYGQLSPNYFELKHYIHVMLESGDIDINWNEETQI